MKRENIIYTSDKREMLYHSVIKCPDGKVRMYANQWKAFHRTVFYESQDNGQTFHVDQNNEDVLIMKSGISHNFYPFQGKDGFYAIGGLDSWKHEARWREVDTYEDFLPMYKERFGADYTKDAARFEVFKKNIRNKKPLAQTSGLYLMSSKDGKKWFLEQEDPIITARHPGFYSGLTAWLPESAKSAEFDGHLSCIWDGEQYRIFLRKNVVWGIRYIQTATSKDLINWTEFQEINLEGFDREKDNYYCPVIIRYKGFYVGFIPYFDNNKYGCVRVIKSQDGINFAIGKDIFQHKTIMLNKKPKNRVQSVNGIIEDNGKIYYYTHENYLGVDSRKPVEIVRYEMTEQEFDELCNI